MHFAQFAWDPSNHQTLDALMSFESKQFSRKREIDFDQEYPDFAQYAIRIRIELKREFRRHLPGEAEYDKWQNEFLRFITPRDTNEIIFGFADVLTDRSKVYEANL
jgi:hypothetical protein